jgi:small subunit ribosomal protein S9
MVTEKVKVKREAGSVKSVAAKGAKLAHGVGRRKTSIARVWLNRGSGVLVVNGKKHTDYFDTELNCKEAAAPIALVPMASNYDVEVNVLGGGMHSQAGAIQLGIARALLSVDESIRSLLRQHNMITVDARRKERKKYGQKAARRKFQFVKR